MNPASGKRKREDDREAQEKIDKGISKYFNSGARAPQPKAQVHGRSPNG